MLVVDLDTQEEQPATIRYAGNPLAMLEQNREAYVSDVLTIVRAYIAEGKPLAELSPLATYSGRWTEFCRQPLVWLGFDDPAKGLIQQLRSNPDLPLLKRILAAWHDQFKERPVMVREVLRDHDRPLEEAIADLPFVVGGPVSGHKFGNYLKKNANRPVGGFRLEKAEHSERNAWRVVRIERSPPEDSA